MSWLGHVACGDLGTSILSHEQVGTLQAIGPTVHLAMLTILLSVVVALPLGTLAARFVQHLQIGFGSSAQLLRAIRGVTFEIRS